MIRSLALILLLAGCSNTYTISAYFKPCDLDIARAYFNTGLGFYLTDTLIEKDLHSDWCRVSVTFERPRQPEWNHPDIVGGNAGWVWGTILEIGDGSDHWVKTATSVSRTVEAIHYENWTRSDGVVGRIALYDKQDVADPRPNACFPDEYPFEDMRVWVTCESSPLSPVQGAWTNQQGSCCTAWDGAITMYPPELCPRHRL